MTMTMTEKERLELLQKLLVERFGELATRQESQITDNVNN
jgi:hypothetical protein